MWKLCGLVPLLGLFFSQPLQAAEVTRVASSFDEDDPFDLHFGVGYDFEFKKAAILREWSDGSSNRIARDLLYQQMRHVITPSLEIGLFRDLAVYVTVPVVIQDSRNYSFDQEASPCKYGDTNEPPANCTNKNNSTTIRDGIIPGGGFDATDTMNPYDNFTGADTKKIFQAPNRRGVDQVWVGLKYAILNQDRLFHMPTWVLAVEGRFAVGKPMTFSRNIVSENPSSNRAVGRGIHELGIRTSLSHRFRYLDPFFTAHWMQAFKASKSEFQDFGEFGQQAKVNPQSQVGFSIGTEIVPWERKAKFQKFAIQLRGNATLFYNGRGYSEMWELLADSPALVGANDPTSAGCDRNKVLAYARTNPEDSNYITNGGGANSTCTRFNGITDIQDFATFGLNAGINAHLSKYATLMLGADLSTNTRHFITGASRGKDLDGNETVEAGTAEVNPLRRDVIDNVGRRYLVDDVLNVMAYFKFMLTF